MNKSSRRYKVLDWLKLHWKGMLTGLVITLLAIFTLSLQLNTLNDGQNRFETQTLSNISSLDYFKETLVNAPYLLPAYGLGQLIDDTLLASRIISVVYGLISTALLFAILNRWFNIRTAAVGSLLFITSAWLLTISHQAAPFIMLVFTPLLLVLYLTKYVNGKEKAFKYLLLLMVALGIAAYIPYMIWSALSVFLVLAFVYRKKLVVINADGLLIAAGLLLLILAPLGYSLYVNPDQIKILLGIPEQLPTISDYLTRFVKQFAAIFVFTDRLPELFIYQKPLIDIFSGAMVALGLYHFYRFMPKRRKISMGLNLVILLLIIPLQPEYLIALTAVLPFIYILIPAGIHEMMRRWFFVFPRNPIARTSAALVIVAVIGLSVTYNLQKFYIAWPNTPETKAAYMIESKEQQ